MSNTVRKMSKTSSATITNSRYNNQLQSFMNKSVESKPFSRLLCVDDSKVAASPSTQIDNVLVQLNKALAVVKYIKASMDIVPKNVMRTLRHLGHEVIGIIGTGKAGDTFSTNNEKGGQKSLFMKLSKKRKAPDDNQLKSASITKHDNALMTKIGNIVCSTEDSKNTSWKQVSTKYKQSKYSHVILSESERLNLRMEANMTCRSWTRFCTTLKRLKGVVLHNSASNSLSKLMAGKMPDFETGHVQVYEAKKLVMRQYFVVEDLLECVRMQIFSVMESGLFIPSNFFTTLTDGSIILRFGGDKGGHFMKFKFGFTVMNTPFPNSPDSFDVLGTLDAEDSAFNLRHGLFNQWVVPLNIMFNEQERLRAVVLKSSSDMLIDVFSATALFQLIRSKTYNCIGQTRRQKILCTQQGYYHSAVNRKTSNGES